MRAIVTGDIGCYTLGALPPLSAMDTTVDMGASASMAHGFELALAGTEHRPIVAVIGDSTFAHSGLSSLISTVYNRGAGTVCVLDNPTTAMTGAQPHPGTGVTLMGPRRKPIDIEAVLRALGVECIVGADPLDLQGSIDAACEAIDFAGPSALIFRSPCVQLIKPAAPVAVDPELCTGCKKCITEIGCPGLGFDAAVRGPRSKERGQAFVDPGQCNGCGLCTQVCPFGAIKETEADHD